MTTPEQKSDKNTKRNKNLGRLASIISLFLSGAVGLWQAWLIPIVNSLGEQGRMNEGDPDGCFYGFLMVPTIFIVPIFVAIAVILALLGFHFKARVIAVIALIVAIVVLLPIIPMWISFFGS